MSDDEDELDGLLRRLGRPTRTERARAERRDRLLAWALIAGLLAGWVLYQLEQPGSLLVWGVVAAVWVWHPDDRMEAFMALAFLLALLGGLVAVLRPVFG